MKQAAAVGGGLAVIALGAIALGVLLMSGGDPEVEEPAAEPIAASEAPAPEEAEIEAPPPRAKVRNRKNRQPTRELYVETTPRPEGDERDPSLPTDAEGWKELRKERNAKWRDNQIALADQWVSANGLAEDQGKEVLEVLNRAHDIIADTRADMEEGVISPRVGREEMAFAKEEVNLEIHSVLGDELAQSFLDEIAKANRGDL